MTRQEIRHKLGLDRKTHNVKCYHCGKELETPTLYSQVDRDKVLKPWCCASTVFTTQWIIHHGWHVTTLEANPAQAFFCDECFHKCFPMGTPEYSKREYGADWCRQAEEWVKLKEE